MSLKGAKKSCWLTLCSWQVRDLVPESQAYMDLLAFERKLDATIMRKRLDIQEALKRPMKVGGFFCFKVKYRLCIIIKMIKIACLILGLL